MALVWKLPVIASKKLRGRIFWNMLIPPEEAAAIKLTHRKLDDELFDKEYINHWITQERKTAADFFGAIPLLKMTTALNSLLQRESTLPKKLSLRKRKIVF